MALENKFKNVALWGDIRLGEQEKYSVGKLSFGRVCGLILIKHHFILENRLYRSV